MILSGDEMGRTQNGNNNAYCQDNDISWIDWRLAGDNEDLVRFFRLLIKFRTDHPVLTGDFAGPDGQIGCATILINIKSVGLIKYGLYISA